MNDYRQLSAADFLEGQILLIDKPLEWTSFDAVKKVRFAIQKTFDLKKIKVGHAGTLDPLATGLLVICTGKFTKKITELTGQDKTYTGTFTLGATTPSYDLETEVEDHKPTGHISPEMVEEAAQRMSGVQQQMPPQFSAKQVDGKRAYESARKGIEVKLQAREVEIKKFEVDTTQLPEVQFEITCTKGTYIRSMARDLGELLGCGAHLSKLVRTAVGDYSLDGAISPGDFSGQVGAPNGEGKPHL
jgi:tRNA pseudouridine55 synthase